MHTFRSCLAVLLGTALLLPAGAQISRYSDLWQSTLGAAAPPPIQVALDGPEVTLNNLEYRDGMLVSVDTTVPASLVLTQDIDAERYRYLRVEMRIGAGKTCRANWISAQADQWGTNPGALLSVSSGETKEYIVPLEGETWAGTITALKFFPAWNTATDVEISRIELLGAPEQRPASLTVVDGEEVTREVFFGSREAWRVTVPEQGRFEAQVTLSPMAWQNYQTDGVRFTVTVDDGNGSTRLVGGRTVAPTTAAADRSWLPLQADLSAWSGKDVLLQLEVDSLESTAGDLAWWGAPMVYSMARDAEATPVILISLDTVRAEQLGVYGYDRETTPFLKDWAADDAVVFENAIVQDGWTLPSHMTMLTGLYPKNHGVTPERHLAESVVTMPETLQAEGYQTGAFTSVTWWLQPFHGFQQGFDVYGNPAPYRHGFATNRRAYDWLDTHAAGDFFLFLHNYDAHSKSHTLGYTRPYQPELQRYAKYSTEFDPAPPLTREGKGDLRASQFLIASNQKKITLSETEHNYIVALYDDAIRSVDGALEDFMAALKARDLYDRALIIITADHGEGMDEHAKWMHEQAYDTCVHVPLIVKFPEGKHAGERFTPMVQLVDIYPTVADTLGLDAALPGDGQSLLALLDGRTEPIELGYTRRHDTNVVRTNDWKLFHDAKNDQWELYDLVEDPGEQKNIYDSDDSGTRDALKTELETFYYTDTEAGAQGEAARELTPEQREELEALGYFE